MPFRRHFLMSCSGAALLALLTAPGATAQQTQSPIILDTVVLRAGVPKVEAEVPQSVTVVDSEELAEIEPGSITEALVMVPGVSNVGSSSFFGQQFNIRGFGGGIAASESGIVQLLDGEKKYYESYRQGALFVEPDFLKRIEVLRGPGSSTLYGSGALGGVIAMDTIEPSDLLAEGATFGGRVKLGYASNPETWMGSAALAWRPAEDFEALLGVAWRQLGSTEDNDGNDIIRANSKTPNLLLKAKKQFGDHYVKFSYQQLEAKGDNQDFDQLNGAQRNLFYPGFSWGVGDITTRDQTARLEWGYNPADNQYVDLKISLSYTDTMKNVEQGDDPAEPIMASLLGKRSYELWRLRAVNVADLSFGDITHYLTAGAEISRQDRTSSSISSSHPEANTNIAAIYALSELTRGQLTINTGLRIERQRTSPKDSVTVTDEKLNETSVEPQIAAIYRLDESWSVFGSIASVSRMPTVDELYDSRGSGAPGMLGAASPDLKPEKAINVEAGFSFAGSDVIAAGDVLTVKTTLFHNLIRDRIERTNAPAPTPSYENIAKAKLWGGEIEAAWQRDRLELGAALSIVEGEDGDGQDLNTLPNNRLVLAAGWQVNDAWKIGARTTLAAGRDKVPSEIFPTGGRRAGYAVHDIFAQWTPTSGPAAGVEVHVGIDNVTNHAYTPAAWESAGPAAGRNFKLSVARRF